MLEPGEQVDARYEVEALIGRGGLAEVYRVRHVDLGSAHALKVLTWTNTKLADRLLLEGRIQAQLNHPNIVSVTDVVRHQGRLALLMEYVDNVSLEALLADRGALPLDEALELFAAVLSAVAAAHQVGVFHRDLKPANVLLARTPRGLVPKVADFGIAKVMVDELAGKTKDGSMMGTPGYMAPEQVLDAGTADGRVDVFALGAILYEMLTGHIAFADPTGEVKIKATLEGRTVPLRDRAPDVPEAIADAIHKAMAVERDDRFADVVAFAQAVYVDRPKLLATVVGQRLGRPLSLERAPRAATVGRPTKPTPNPTITPAPSGREAPSSPTLAATYELADEAPRRRGVWLVLLAIALVVVAVVVAVGAWAAVSGLGGGSTAEVTGEAFVEVPDPATTPPTDPADPVAVAPEPVDEPSGAVAAPSVPEPAPAIDAGAAEAPAANAEVVDALDAAPPSETVEPAPTEATDPPPDDADEPDAVVDIETPTEPGPPAVPAPTYPSLVGVWDGEADGRPFQLRFGPQSGGNIEATATFFLGPTQRTAALTGTISETGKVVLQQAGRGLVLTGDLARSRINGTYSQGGAKKQFTFWVSPGG